MNNCTNHKLRLRTRRWQRWVLKSQKLTMDSIYPNKPTWCLALIKTLPKLCIFNRGQPEWILNKSTTAPELESLGISRGSISSFFTHIFVVGEDKVITQTQRTVKWLLLTTRARSSEYQLYLHSPNAVKNQPSKLSQNWTLPHVETLRNLRIGGAASSPITWISMRQGKVFKAIRKILILHRRETQSSGMQACIKNHRLIWKTPFHMNRCWSNWTKLIAKLRIIRKVIS